MSSDKYGNHRTGANSSPRRGSSFIGAKTHSTFDEEPTHALEDQVIARARALVRANATDVDDARFLLGFLGLIDPSDLTDDGQDLDGDAPAEGGATLARIWLYSDPQHPTPPGSLNLGHVYLARRQVCTRAADATEARELMSLLGLQPRGEIERQARALAHAGSPRTGARA